MNKQVDRYAKKEKQIKNRVKILNKYIFLY